ncbi:MAG: hypothetical protein QNJ85_06850 [Gammaproteobacteria bacterium]|nr:hypothetical protein [Gammaproteobacteria bacterium]
MNPDDRQDTAGQARHELPAFWWLYFPLLFFAFRYAVFLLTDTESGMESWVRGELGLVENLTVLFSAAALVLTLGVILRLGRSLPPLLNLFLVLYALGCLYFAGEEASWGQHWFGWETGEYFLERNDQQETNLHNTSIWLDRIPKAIVSLGIFIGGIVLPLVFRFRARAQDNRSRFWWLWPTWICLPTAILATTVTWPGKIEHYTDLSFYFELSNEMKEFYIGYFFLLFILSLSVRLYRQQRTTADEPVMKQGAG